jgi:AmiR/NasT family two-component response regulator
MTSARVFIWYGHPLFARAMEALLRREGMQIVGSSGDAVEAVPAILRSRPDVVVADRIVEREHPLGIAEIIRVCQRIRVLVLDLIEDGMRIYDGQGSGAGKVQAIVAAIEEAAGHTLSAA